jgi:hypothetical protein
MASARRRRQGADSEPIRYGGGMSDEHHTDPQFWREQSAALRSLAEKTEDFYLKASFSGALMSTIAWRSEPKRDCAFRGDNNATRPPDGHYSAMSCHIPARGSLVELWGQASGSFKPPSTTSPVWEEL